jgi:hypothetical protein
LNPHTNPENRLVLSQQSKQGKMAIADFTPKPFTHLALKSISAQWVLKAFNEG